MVLNIGVKWGIVGVKIGFFNILLAIENEKKVIHSVSISDINVWSLSNESVARTGMNINNKVLDISCPTTKSLFW